MIFRDYVIFQTVEHEYWERYIGLSRDLYALNERLIRCLLIIFAYITFIIALTIIRIVT